MRDFGFFFGDFNFTSERFQDNMWSFNFSNLNLASESYIEDEAQGVQSIAA